MSQGEDQTPDSGPPPYAAEESYGGPPPYTAEETFGGPPPYAAEASYGAHHHPTLPKSLMLDLRPMTCLGPIRVLGPIGGPLQRDGRCGDSTAVAGR